MARACVHYHCPACGDQTFCFMQQLGKGDVLTCPNGHIYRLEQGQRDRINLAFRSYINAQVEVYI